MRWRLVLHLAVIASAVPLSTPHWPVIPPIPREERFLARSGLAATLQLKASQITAGELPTITLSLRNTGGGTLRLPPDVSADLNVRLRVFDASGKELHSATSCIHDRVVLLASVRTYRALGPGRARVFPLDTPCGGLPPLPAGDYRFDATYWNYPDAPGAYDVYEQGASETWDGRITTPRVPLTVVPLDAATERSLIARVDAAGTPDGISDAIARLGLGGTASATPALIRRFDRDPLHRADVTRALAHIPDAGAAAALGEAIERLSPEPRRFLQISFLLEDAWLPLVQRAQGCSALTLVLDMPGQREEAARILDARCPDLRAQLRRASQQPSSTTPSAELMRLRDRSVRAASLLTVLDGLASPQPAAASEDETFVDEIRPDPADVSEYVDELVAGINDGAGRERALKGVAWFGSVDDFLRLKRAFAAGNERSRGWLLDALVRMTFSSDRDASRNMEPAYWDAWWKTHAGQTRVQWARKVLDGGMLRSKLTPHDQAPSRAATFLLADQGLSPALVRELATHRSWLVRLAVADAVAEADDQSGGRLFLREFSNRYVAACAAANEKLERLVRRRYRFDCSDPAQRREAIAHWTEVLNGLGPGFLPLTVAISEP